MFGRFWFKTKDKFNKTISQKKEIQTKSF